jgi:hypothetical protein
MNEQVELWPKPIMYGAGFKITTHPHQYQKVFQMYLDQMMMAMYPLYMGKNETLSKIP